MGNGASTNVKQISITKRATKRVNSAPRKSNVQAVTLDGASGTSIPTKLGWTRSNSDGCIVESLNTSKTKVELLEQQLNEFKELFHDAEQKADGAEARAKLLEQQMAEVEGANFELLDLVSELEQQLEELKDQTSPEAEMEFTQTLLEQNQTIEKQEQEIKRQELELAKMRVKAKKKLRSAQTELAEARQEAGLKLYSLKDELAKLQVENTKLTERLDRAHSTSSAQSRQRTTPSNHSLEAAPEEDNEEEWEDGRTKVILELSGQLSAQDQRISELEELVQEKDRTITGLQGRVNPRPPSGPQGGSSTRSDKTMKANPGDPETDGTHQRQRAFSSSSSSTSKRRKSHRSSSAGRWTSSDGERQNEISQTNDDVGGDDDTRQQQRTSSASSTSKGRDTHQSSSAGRRTSSGGQRQKESNRDDADCSAHHQIRDVGSAGSNSSRKPRQFSANSTDSAISDHSDSGATKASSRSSSRQRRRQKDQLSRKSSPEGPLVSTEQHSDFRIEGRDSGIGVTTDVKSRDSDDLDQMMDDMIGNS